MLGSRNQQPWEPWRTPDLSLSKTGWWCHMSRKMSSVGRPLPLGCFTDTSILSWSSCHSIFCLDSIHITQHVEDWVARCICNHNLMCIHVHFKRGDDLKPYSKKKCATDPCLLPGICYLVNADKTPVLFIHQSPCSTSTISQSLCQEKWWREGRRKELFRDQDWLLGQQVNKSWLERSVGVCWQGELSQQKPGEHLYMGWGWRLNTRVIWRGCCPTVGKGGKDEWDTSVVWGRPQLTRRDRLGVTVKGVPLHIVSHASLFLDRTANVLKQRAGWPGLSSLSSA